MSRGKQNEILSGSAQITFWRYRYMKYTDFALEHVNVTTGQGETAVSGQMTSSFPPGDLVNDRFGWFAFPALPTSTQPVMLI